MKWWLYLARRRFRRPCFDGMRCGCTPIGGSGAEVVEIVDPRWWRVDRWIVWRRCWLALELMLPDGTGKTMFMRLRVREVGPSWK